MPILYLLGVLFLGFVSIVVFYFFVFSVALAIVKFIFNNSAWFFLIFLFAMGFILSNFL